MGDFLTQKNCDLMCSGPEWDTRTRPSHSLGACSERENYMQKHTQNDAPLCTFKKYEDIVLISLKKYVHKAQLKEKIHLFFIIS